MDFLFDINLWIISIKMGFEIALLSVVIYTVLLFIKGTRAAPILAGAAFIFLISWLISSVLDLAVLGWITAQISTLVAFLAIVIFQPEIRRAFAELGKGRLRNNNQAKTKEVIQILNESAHYLAERKIGALIAIERNIGMRFLAESGVQINSELSRELLCTIFYPNTPLHDGGVIISGDKINASACFFPLSQDDGIIKSLGSRHRAGVGVTEETDCICIIVSEETGGISISYRGRLARGVDEQRLLRHLNNFLLNSKENKNFSVSDNVERFKKAVSQSEDNQDEV
ncbi:diadenylate cyclase CdaA [Lentisphaera profundi]|uniref:Diadenylate cyclase n=1 Tax=Lentisphaera profundi TaxID=1658616 RepID=A0ABY7VTN2_9BACT|nr:diadenylate cyclase CdaA [Lentisphaera profundi]WDE97087.1 diadenylate cyclase CdaA [Lentisphaera profundi]